MIWVIVSTSDGATTTVCSKCYYGVSDFKSLWFNFYMQFIFQAKQFLFVWNFIRTATKFQKLVLRELQPLPQMALKYSFSRLLANGVAFLHICVIWITNVIWCWWNKLLQSYCFWNNNCCSSTLALIWGLIGKPLDSIFYHTQEKSFKENKSNFYCWLSSGIDMKDI